MASLKQIQKKILKEIKQAQHVMLVAHQKPDGDAAGSVLAMAHYLEDQKINFTCFCDGELNPTLRFLPKSEHMMCDQSNFADSKFDLLIVLDSGDLRYAGIADHLNALTHDFKIINIDHHPTNEHFGDYNLVIKNASSTSEIVHDLLDNVQALNKNIATCLLTGIITDTNGFSNLATTASSVEAASKLLLYGANLAEINKNTLNHRPVNTLNLWGRALERLQQFPATGLVVTFITRQDLKECKADAEAIEGVSNFLNSLKESRDSTIMVLNEREPGVIKGSLRTTCPLIDVSKFAKLMGGGGHKKAAGFSINGSLTQNNNDWRIKKPN